jgi:hypothetical protein
MERILLLILMIYAAIGLVLSLIVHLLSFVGVQPGGDALFFGLHVGIFPLWLPVVWIYSKLTGGMARQYSRTSWNSGFSSWNSWQVVYSGCPLWMKYMTNGFFIYAIINFVLFVVSGSGSPVAGSPSASVWHGFSGHWMAFYSAGLAVGTAAYRRGLSNLSPTCLNGHPIAYGDRFCSVCGAALARQKS